ncbi:MAG: hypothetical protein ACFCGT_11295 [Sandaracinaceae bacterium]
MASLPDQGPYRVSPKWRSGQYRSVLFVSLFALLFALGFAGYGLYALVDSFHVSDLAKNGVRVDDVAYDGTERSRWGLFKTYDLDVQFLDQSGRLVEFNSGFFHFGTGGSDGEPHVLHAADDPPDAILSWEADNLWHGRSLYLFMILLGLGVLIGGAYHAFDTTRDVKLVEDLAASGRLAWGRIVDEKRQQANKTTQVTMTLELEDGATHVHKYSEPREPMIKEGEQGEEYVACLRGTAGIRGIDKNGEPLLLEG